MAKSKIIYQLQRKVEIAAVVLSEYGVIDSSDLTVFSEKIGVKYRTLQSALGKGAVSQDVELAICKACGISPSDQCWCDTMQSISSKESIVEYQGSDTAANFEKILRTKFNSDKTLLVFQDSFSHLHEHFPSHCISSSPQISDTKDKFPIFLELDSSHQYSDDGIKFGFSSYKVSFPSLCNVEFTEKLGELEDYEIGDALLNARGTRLSPYWTICSAKNGVALNGTYITSKRPLAWVEKNNGKAILPSELSTNVYDSVVFENEPNSKVSANKETILKALLSRELSDNASSGSGWIKFSIHKLHVHEEEA